MSKIYVQAPFTDNQLAQLKEMAMRCGDELYFSPLQLSMSGLGFQETGGKEPVSLSEVDAIIGNVPAGKLAKAQAAGGLKLSWMQLNSSGADAYVKEGVLPQQTVLTSATGAYGTGIAEYMVCMLLNMMKKVPSYLEDQKKHLWTDEGLVTTPLGKRILIVGTGNIGMEFARRMKAFGGTLVGIRRRADHCPEGLDEIHSLSALKEEAAKADVIAVSLPGTQETYHLFDRELLSCCKEGAYLMNVGRGNVVDDRALLDVGVSSRFAGIWLDVCETEPLPSEDPLYDVPNLLLTPHITGGFHLDLTLQNIFDISMHNYRAFHGEGEYQSVVDRATGYCR